MSDLRNATVLLQKSRYIHFFVVIFSFIFVFCLFFFIKLHRFLLNFLVLPLFVFQNKQKWRFCVFFFCSSCFFALGLTVVQIGEVFGPFPPLSKTKKSKQKKQKNKKILWRIHSLARLDTWIESGSVKSGNAKTYCFVLWGWWCTKFVC